MYSHPASKDHNVMFELQMTSLDDNRNNNLNYIAKSPDCKYFYLEHEVHLETSQNNNATKCSGKVGALQVQSHWARGS